MGGSALGDLGAEVDALGAAVHREGLPLGARPFPHHPGHRNHRCQGTPRDRTTPEGGGGAPPARMLRGQPSVG